MARSLKKKETAKKDRLERLKENRNLWLKLPTEVFVNILMRLSLLDCIRAKAVCLTWRADVIKMVACNAHPPSHQVAMLMPTKDRKTLIYRVLNLPDNNVYKLHLWQFSPAICLGSSDEWLILMDKNTKGCFLLNLRSNEQIQLPRQATVCNSGKYRNVEDFWKHGTGLNAKAILSFDTASASSADGYKANCIYFANAKKGDDSGVFHLQDGSIEVFPPSISYQILSQQGCYL
ncbi:probable F-box protein At4g22060 [Magnolia sinica]|uniref:probable F-box protein At4g22060 n=1 Tax=Magnolia sinica TaxID=86752 RepID=UPI00265AEB0A|nr:probable F-box protein At4g22060 [Magnolia sinica]